MGDKAPLVRTGQANVDAVAQAADATTLVAEAPFDGTVSGVTYTPNADRAGAALPDSRHLALVNRGQAGAGSTSVAALALLAGVDLTAGDEKAIPLSGTAANLVVVAGDELAWVSTHDGAGIVDPGGLVQVEFGRS